MFWNNIFGKKVSMKKIITTFLFLFITSFLYAQQFGIKAGLNLTNVYGDDKVFLDDDFTNPLKPGAKITVFAQFGEESIRFITNVGISQKGFMMKDQYEDPLGSVKAKGTYHLNYLDVNTSANYFVSDVLSLNLGAGLLILLNGKNTLDYYDVTGTYVGLFEDFEDDAEIGEDITGIDFGVSLGSTFYITEKLFLDANYYLGLVTLDPDGDDSIYNNSITVSCGYVF